jgi:hypothetical protein
MITFVIGVVIMVSAAIFVRATGFMADMASMLERFMLMQAVLVRFVL